MDEWEAIAFGVYRWPRSTMRFRRLSARLLAERQWCEVCGAPAEVLVHREMALPGFPARTYDPNNLAACCWDCRYRGDQWRKGPMKVDDRSDEFRARQISAEAAQHAEDTV